MLVNPWGYKGAMKKEKKKDIFFDIDGVITIETEGYSNAEYLARTPNNNTISLINVLYERGEHKITLYTARHLEDREVTEQWLSENEVKYHELILDKPHYDILIDDRAFRFNDLPLRIMTAIYDLA